MLKRHPSLKDLSEYAGSHADAPSASSIDKHVRSCRRCAQNVELLRRLDVLARSALIESDEQTGAHGCPPPLVLADYLEGLLPAQQRVTTEEHLSSCRLCRDALIQIQEMTMIEYDSAEPDEIADDLLEPDEATRRRTLNLIKTKLREQRVRCGICGEENEPGSLVCSGCGAQLKRPSHTLLCISCRQQIPAASNYCPNCGSAIAPPKKIFGLIRARSTAVTGLIRTHVWAVLGLAAIGISFFAHRYFIQFIALGLIFGAKWVLDQVQLRIYADILKRLRSEGKTEEQKKRISGSG
ncbi:MAG: hypothetical protein C4532_17165 [Candidatus Abyssobacteria bacterium SURF_17]|uniref:DZANK-type domain-containing protein n=1 Tax=Candidatus Abyssobacteria bacterium SURF_17 TaxID=2093361 RepID=A0A419EQW4_9BACT|nr:MAG: hypothetical protein C4532_17165 [Candidatus Abyssubacteria bacterium SURF_17]